MSLPDVRRLATLALTLMCVPRLVLSAVAALAVCASMSRYSEGWDPSLGYPLIGGALVHLATSCLLVWLNLARPDAVGRVFATERPDGAEAIGCAAIRVFCLMELVFALSNATRELPFAIRMSGPHGVFSGVGWPVWAATGGSFRSRRSCCSSPRPGSSSGSCGRSIRGSCGGARLCGGGGRW